MLTKLQTFTSIFSLLSAGPCHEILFGGSTAASITKVALVRGGGEGMLKYNVESKRDQENTLKRLFFKIKRCARAAHVGVQKRLIFIKKCTFFKIL